MRQIAEFVVLAFHLYNQGTFLSFFVPFFLSFLTPSICFVFENFFVGLLDARPN